jgi:hypothetical protein
MEKRDDNDNVVALGHVAQTGRYSPDDNRHVYLRVRLQSDCRVRPEDGRMEPRDPASSTWRRRCLPVPDQQQGRPVQLLQHLLAHQKSVRPTTLSYISNANQTFVVYTSNYQYETTCHDRAGIIQICISPT